MRCYSCVICGGIEIVSDDVERLEHRHPAGICMLLEIPVSNTTLQSSYIIQQAVSTLSLFPPKQIVTNELLEKTLKSLKFDVKNKYLLLVDPSMIDLEEFAKAKWWEDIHTPDIFIVPIMIPPGKTIDDAIIIKESAFAIQDWLLKTFERTDHEENS